jgi:hypothetical protein
LQIERLDQCVARPDPPGVSLRTLILIEPGRRPNFQLRTYACIRCGTDESFLMAIKPVESVIRVSQDRRLRRAPDWRNILQVKSARMPW